MKALGGKPLVQWTIDVAKSCEMFANIVISSDDARTIDQSLHMGCDTYHLRKSGHSDDDAPDFLWVDDVMRDVRADLFAILRPTSPFRTASTIRRAYARLIGSGADSVRAVEKVAQHPGKMWVDDGKFIRPILEGGSLSDGPSPYHADGTPWHSSPTQTLPKVYVQNASLEMAWTYVLKQHKTIHGVRVAPFLTEPIEGFDINTPEDWERAEAIAATWSR